MMRDCEGQVARVRETASRKCDTWTDRWILHTCVHSSTHMEALRRQHSMYCCIKEAAPARGSNWLSAELASEGRSTMSKTGEMENLTSVLSGMRASVIGKLFAPRAESRGLEPFIAESTAFQM
eukprot:13811-Rhodomonas_salina.4